MADISKRNLEQGILPDIKQSVGEKDIIIPTKLQNEWRKPDRLKNNFKKSSITVGYIITLLSEIHRTSKHTINIWKTWETEVNQGVNPSNQQK